MTTDLQRVLHSVGKLITELSVYPQETQRWPLIPPISTNALFATVNGRRFKTKEYKAWLGVQQTEFIAAPPSRKRFESAAVILRPQKNKIDTDNTNKAYLDAMVKVGILADDDAIVCCLTWPMLAEAPGYALVVPDLGD